MKDSNELSESLTKNAEWLKREDDR
jgi:hypothetical protein